jgi:hypothetical protein
MRKRRTSGYTVHKVRRRQWPSDLLGRVGSAGWAPEAERPAPAVPGRPTGHDPQDATRPGGLRESSTRSLEVGLLRRMRFVRGR